MPWTTVGTSTTTWGGGTVTSQTYTPLTRDVTVWSLPRPLAEAGALSPALDFELQFRDTGYGVFSEDRTLLFLSSISEGTP